MVTMRRGNSAAVHWPLTVRDGAAKGEHCAIIIQSRAFRWRPKADWLAVLYGYGTSGGVA